MDSQLHLYYYPGHASLAPHILLHELKLEYKLILVDIKSGAQFDSAYSALNPLCKIPVLSCDGLLITESAAICTWLALQHKYISSEDSDQLQWMFYLSSTLQNLLMEYHYPKNNVSDVTHVSETVRNEIGFHLQHINSALCSSSTLAKRFSISDIYLTMLCYWCRTFLDEIPNIDNLKVALKKHRTRSSVDKAFSIEGIGTYVP